MTEPTAKADLEAEIVQELHLALDLAGADDLCDIVTGWRATLSDEQVLAALKEHNARQCGPH